MIRVQKAMLYGAGDLRLEEEPVDPAGMGAGEILVRTEATAFSTGTDLGNYVGRSTEVPGAPDYPRAVGYSNAGVVWQTGAAVSGFRPGDRVFGVKPHRSAYVAAATDLLVAVPGNVPAEEASLAYLVNLGVAALRQARFEPGERVAVVGLGVIGLATVAVARTMGAQVAAWANDGSRAALAGGLGAQHVFESGKASAGDVFDGAGADIVILTANPWPAFRDALEMAAQGGRVSLLGFPGRAQPAPDFNPLDARWLYAKQLTLLGSGHIPRVECAASDIRFNLRRNLACIFEWMSSGALNLAPIISHRIPYTRMRDAYELARGHSKELTAAVFDWRTAHPVGAP
jgi:threonine dehydrogenase-like Zn-dependent dehydrogenase